MAAKAPSARRLQAVKAEKWNVPGFDEPFVQDPLTFFEKNEFFGLVARAVEEVVYTTGDLTALVTMLGISDDQITDIRKGKVDPELIMATPQMIGVLSRIVASVPQLMEDMYLLILSVPLEKRETVREGLRQIDDDTGFGILDTFVDQNAGTLRDFFPRWRELVTKTMERMANRSTGPSTVESTTSTD